jgi:hypothetical protein
VSYRATAIVLSAALLLIAGASAPVVAQSKFAEEDMREIVRILFEQQLAGDREGKEIELVLSPRFYPNWIPTLPGVKFRKMPYSEERSGIVYYEVSRPERKAGEIVLALMKGNACSKAGETYAFRRKEGKWISRLVGQVSSGTFTGACPGCDLRSGELYSVSRKPSNDETSPQPDRMGPSLSGRVLNVECHRIERPYVRCTANVALTLANGANNPLIVMQPFEDYDSWHGGTSLALTADDAIHHRLVYSTEAWPSIYTHAVYQRLAELLDQPRPPAKVTRTIEPGGKWEYQTSVTWAVETENHCHGSLGVEIGWNEIKKQAKPLWMKVSFEMWPFNVENFKKDLGVKLRERWKSFGDLYLDPKDKGDRYSFWQLTSTPIELDLTKVVIDDK